MNSSAPETGQRTDEDVVREAMADHDKHYWCLVRTLKQRRKDWAELAKLLGEGSTVAMAIWKKYSEMETPHAAAETGEQGKGQLQPSTRANRDRDDIEQPTVLCGSGKDFHGPDYKHAYQSPAVRQGGETKADYECAAIKTGSVGGMSPQDCGWPFCGCDPRANKVITTLLECGWQPPAHSLASQPSQQTPATQIRPRLACAYCTLPIRWTCDGHVVYRHKHDNSDKCGPNKDEPIQWATLTKWPPEAQSAQEPRDESWRKLEIGQWFFSDDPRCERRYSVMERTSSGCTAICSSPWTHESAKKDMQEIARLHNATSPSAPAARCPSCKVQWKKKPEDYREWIEVGVFSIFCSTCGTTFRLLHVEDFTQFFLPSQAAKETP